MTEVKTSPWAYYIFWWQLLSGRNTQYKGMCHTMIALPFTLKKYLKGKTRNMETQIFHHAKIY
jgi:hypothetical protein